jgi:hypothetical protein
MSRNTGRARACQQTQRCMAALQAGLGGVARPNSSALYASCAAASMRATLHSTSPSAVRLQKLCATQRASCVFAKTQHVTTHAASHL